MTGSIVAFSIDTAQGLLDSGERFPVDLDAAWQWLGYTRRDVAIKKMRHFSEGKDFHQVMEKTAGRPIQKYFLTVDCFKSLGMMAQTEQGDLVREYFLECERRLKGSHLQPHSSADLLIQMAEMFKQQALAFKQHEERMSAIESRSAMIEESVQAMQMATAEAHKELIALPPATHEVPAETVDMKIRRLVNSYCVSTGIQQGEVFRVLYTQFYYRYRRNVKPEPRESKLQAFNRLGLIDALYDLSIELFSVKAG